MQLTARERDMLEGKDGEGTAMAMRILVAASEALGAHALVPIASAHVDGCLYHGDSGTLFAEHLARSGAHTSVPTTLNVGALDLIHANRTRLAQHEHSMAERMMTAYVSLGCRPTWTCAPYQAGHRPRLGSDVAWGESNAVAFCNSVLGARTNRYGDSLDICAAITGRAPRVGLHVPEKRVATVLVDASELGDEWLREDTTFVLVGAWLGSVIGERVAAFQGLGHPTEDQLKAMAAASASTGAVGLFHVIGVTPEAGTCDTAFGSKPPEEILHLTRAALSEMRSRLSTAVVAPGDSIDAVAIGSPHLSVTELRQLGQMLGEHRCSVPLYACTGRHVLTAVADERLGERLQSLGVVIVADTCVVVTPILPASGGVLVTNSGKFAHYAPSNTGYSVVFAALRDCVASAITGKLVYTSGSVA